MYGTITLTDTPDPVVAGAVLTYTASATNGGASDAQDVAITVNLPAEGTLQSASASLGGSCSGTGPVVCSWAGATAPPAQRTATVAVTIAAGTPAGTQVFADAQVGTATNDPAPGNNAANTTTLVTAEADVSITLTDSPDPVVAGTQLSYLATLSNNGISAQPSFAELQNLFDWMVVCTLIERQKLSQSIDWTPQVLSNAKLLPTSTYPVPEGVDAVAATKNQGRTMLGLVGGVTLNADSVASHTTPMMNDSATSIPARHESRFWND